MTITSPIAIVLDTTPLGLLTQKKGIAEADTCRIWAAGLMQFGCRFFVPEIADYELRREFVRQGNLGAVSRMDVFNAGVNGAYLPLTTPEVRLAAALWARVRNQGKTTAPPEALDGDALIAAQADFLDFATFGLSSVVVATANAGHLSALTSAALWSDIGYQSVIEKVL